jgi:hypothetical protein
MMKTLLRTSLLAALLAACGSAFGAQLSVGVRIGPPPRPRVVRVQPARPGPEYTWVDGYWYPVGRKYQWHEGYWTRPPYAGARWVTPQYRDGQFYGGAWDGDRGRFDHNHRWDRDRRNRDGDRYRDRR